MGFEILIGHRLVYLPSVYLTVRCPGNEELYCYNYRMKGKQKRVTVIREMKLQHKEFLYHNYITISKSSCMYCLYLSDWVSDNSVHPTEWLKTYICISVAKCVVYTIQFAISMLNKIKGICRCTPNYVPYFAKILLKVGFYCSRFNSSTGTTITN